MGTAESTAISLSHHTRVWGASEQGHEGCELYAHVSESWLAWECVSTWVAREGVSEPEGVSRCLGGV